MPDQPSSRPDKPARSRWSRVAQPFRALYQAGRDNQHFLLPALNGALGDVLAERGDRRAIRMSFRLNDADVPASALSLTDGPRRTVVFLHGLMGDEYIWQQGTPEAPRFGPRLEQDAHVRCLYVRYNTGLHISQNGRQLSQLLTELVEHWPEAISELVLVGHSMGGLVIRSAGHYAYQADTPAPWVARLRQVFLLGVPNEGSFLEQHSFLTSLALRKLDWRLSRLLANALDRRSSGIRDLRNARLTDEDWQDPHADDVVAPPGTPVPPLPGVRYHLLAASLLRNDHSTLARYFGDGLVGGRSATGNVFGQPTALATAQVQIRTFGRQHHGTLLSHPEVYEYLRSRL